KRTSPQSGSSSRLIILSAVVLPDPDVPTNAMKPPESMRSVTSRRAWLRSPSKDFVRLMSSMSGAEAMPSAQHLGDSHTPYLVAWVERQGNPGAFALLTAGPGLRLRSTPGYACLRRSSTTPFQNRTASKCCCPCQPNFVFWVGRVIRSDLEQTPPLWEAIGDFDLRCRRSTRRK